MKFINDIHQPSINPILNLLPQVQMNTTVREDTYAVSEIILTIRIHSCCSVQATWNEGMLNACHLGLLVRCSVVLVQII